MYKLLCVVISFILPLVIAANDLDIEIDEQIIGSKLVKQYEQLASRPLYKNMPCLNEWISHLSETCEPNVPNDFLQKKAARFKECYMKARGTGGFSCIDGSTEKGKKLSPIRCLLGQGMPEQQLQIWATSFANIKPMCAHFAYAKLHWFELFVFLFVSNEYLVALSIRGFFLLMTTILNKNYLARFFLYMLNCKRR